MSAAGPLNALREARTELVFINDPHTHAIGVIDQINGALDAALDHDITDSMIAAAPEMFEALKKAEAAIRSAIPFHAKDDEEAAQLLPLIVAALAKAEGK